ncbi:MAG: hypothetical protein HKN87_21385 [Saprospiraceae bacterium]|nr:hypothetical protein [Saprospiraceae bacterium]
MKFRQQEDDRSFGGDLPVGDLLGNQQLDFLVYRSENSVEGGAVQPCFLGAFTSDGSILWQKGEGGYQPNRPGPVALYDIDGDGHDEVICLFATRKNLDPFSMQGVELQILNGSDGSIIKSARPPLILSANGEGANWVHQRILVAHLSDAQRPQDFIIKLGKMLLAFDRDLNVLWTYDNENDSYQNCPAYIPSLGDIDGDGRNEINGGYYLLNEDGKVLWEKKLGKNMDSVTIHYWDDANKKRAFCSGEGFIMDEKGDTILMLGAEIVLHGQELRVANFDPHSTGPEMAIRYEGHKPAVRIFNTSGEVLSEFVLNDSPNHTGMEAIFWHGKNAPALLYNGGAHWQGNGTHLASFMELPTPPSGPKRQGWYHCIPLDISGDDGEEVLVYNPWDKDLFIFAAPRENWMDLKPFHPTVRQYNVRLMD